MPACPQDKTIDPNAMEGTLFGPIFLMYAVFFTQLVGELSSHLVAGFA